MGAVTTETSGKNNADALAGRSYKALPAEFYITLEPTAFPNVQPFVTNQKLAAQLGLESFDEDAPETLSLLSGGATSNGCDAIAMAYAGHQFGHYSPLLGDGRARLVAERTRPDGAIFDIHLKGAGATPFSRGADGKATIGSAVREYVMSEAMAALGAPTTRALAIVTTGEIVSRDSVHPGAVLARTARSHLRVGTFQYAANLKEQDRLKALADHAIDRLYPEISASDTNKYARLIEAVCVAQARLIAAWMGFGFIHGVMNTDNCTISGETIDYGPCAYIDVFHPGKVFSSIDRYGRYAWSKQPEIGQWNLTRLAEALLPLLGETETAQTETATTALKAYTETFQAEFANTMARKLGLLASQREFSDFLTETFSLMTECALDFTEFFTQLTRYANGDAPTLRIGDNEFAGKISQWKEKWVALRGAADGAGRDGASNMRAANPVRIARNHQVERAIGHAERGDKSLMISLLDALAQPFEENDQYSAFEAPPLPEEEVRQTFCGT